MEKVWLKHYPEGIPAEIDPSQFPSIVSMFKHVCSQYSERSSFENMGASMTYSELDTVSNDFASFLQNELKLQKGDRIAIQMPNVLQFPVAMFGALKAGLVVVNTNPLYTAREMKHQFNDSGAKAVVILANFASELEEVLSETNIEHVVVTQLGDLLGWPKSHIVNFVVNYIKKMVPKYNLPTETYSFLDALNIGSQAKFQPVETSPEDLAFLQYTGGTTGVAKGAMLSHRNIVANMLQVQAWIRGAVKDGEEIVITPLPLYHIFSLTVNCLCLMSVGATNVLITNPKDIPTFVKTLNKYKFTIMTGVNTLYNALLNNTEFANGDYSSLKFSVAGGMALQTAVARKWQEVVGSPVVEGFGLTETSPCACVNPFDGRAKEGTIGMPIPSTDIKIIDEDNNEVPMGEPGELCIKGPQVMQGYWQRPDETANVMLEGGWLKTGDVAQVDEEGYLKIVDRKKDMILVSGFNVFPNEVEDIIAKHPKVLEVAAIGVPDDKSGEVVKIFVVKKDESLTDNEILSLCKEELVAYKRPKYIEFRSELPKTNVGKILRRALRT